MKKTDTKKTNQSAPASIREGLSKLSPLPCEAGAFFGKIRGLWLRLLDYFFPVYIYATDPARGRDWGAMVISKVRRDGIVEVVSVKHFKNEEGAE